MSICCLFVGAIENELGMLFWFVCAYVCVCVISIAIPVYMKIWKIVEQFKQFLGLFCHSIFIFELKENSESLSCLCVSVSLVLLPEDIHTESVQLPVFQNHIEQSLTHVQEYAQGILPVTQESWRNIISSALFCQKKLDNDDNNNNVDLHYTLTAISTIRFTIATYRIKS